MSVIVSKGKKKGLPFEVTFQYQPLIAGKLDVFVAGDFNDFNSTEYKMIEKNGIYSLTIPFGEGKYQYKFIINGFWMKDDDSMEIQADGFGEYNSVLYVGDLDEINSLRLVLFKYPSLKNDLKVYLAGDFNEWQFSRDRMYYNSEEKIYEIYAPLKIGHYNYKFIVDNKWIIDHSNPTTSPDNLGGYNSVIIVDSSIKKYNSNCNHLIFFGLIHADPTFYLNQKSINSYEVRIKTFKGNCDSLDLVINDQIMPLSVEDKNHYFDYYLYQFQSDEKDFNFYFILKKNEKTYYIYPDIISKHLISDLYFTYERSKHKPFFTPDWVKNGIIYQIFVDRFCNGNPAINQDFKEWYYKGKNVSPSPGNYLKPGEEYFNFVENWYDYSGLIKSPFQKDGHPDTNSFYGGDFEGLTQKLKYLADLGITIIYLNPVFEAPSNHKYDAADYLNPDPHFGTKKDFKNLVKKAHELGIRIIIDVAFNHTGDAFFAFNESSEKGPESPYYSWYEWKKWPLPENQEYNPSDYYNCWWGFGHMPDLDFDKSRLSPYENGVKNISDADPNWEVINYIYKVIDFWVGDMDIDGFRLDVPNEVPFWFWKLFRLKVKSVKPDAYLVGEIWHDAKEWIGENAFDAVMNYAGFKDPVMLFFNLRQCNAEAFDKYLKTGLMLYPPQANQTMMNLLDGHDTFRFLEIADGDHIKLKLAILFQMTFVGVPHIWYGDEIGMLGSHDPDCRRPFNWKFQEDSASVELRKYYIQMIKIRKNYSALRSENFKTLLTKNNLYAYKRWDQAQTFYIFINNDPEKQIINFHIDSSKTKLQDILSDKNYRLRNGYLSLSIPAFSGIILLNQ